MALPKRYNPKTAEPRLLAQWQEAGTYHFDPNQPDRQAIIDTPPPTVSGHLHLGHVYSYSHPDFMARYWRMRGQNVLYPMGFDDNGLPTERLVERWENVRATEIGRQAFIEKCLQVSEESEKEYQALWQRLGLSIDWRYTYRTIDENTRRFSQLSFIDLYKKGLVYRDRAPAIWCPECRTAIAQAELNDLDRESEYVTIDFRLENGETLPIATTRPELLPACVAVFIHPDDGRFTHYIGQQVRVPLIDRFVPLLADSDADPEKGTGAVMCCTFGDTADVAWWYTHNLDLIEIMGKDGRLTAEAGEIAGLTVPEARRHIKEILREEGLLLGSQPTSQTIRVHERCDTPVEYIVANQWFIKVLDFKEQFIEAGERITWHPAHMGARYRQWVENLNWDWCISRQRYFGVTFPVWYCAQCGEPILAPEEALPIDPTTSQPDHPCACGSTSFTPESDVMDTWATSSLTPQIVGQWLGQSGFDGQPFQPLTLRPQAQEIIRTWAFYSIVKAYHHLGKLPWREAAISGWGLAGEGMPKISKSRGGGPMAPMEMIEQYSADAVRYWAAGTGFGRDAIISEQKIQAGAKLVNKLWNVARFSGRFLENYQLPITDKPTNPITQLPNYHFSLADRWILSRMQQLIGRVTELMDNFDYATAKSEIEVFFWTDLADNYLEMAKKRLYDDDDPAHDGAKFALYHILYDTIKLFAPFLPYVTEAIYQGIFDKSTSIHRVPWPEANAALLDESAESAGEALLTIATAVRRYKSEAGLSLGTELPTLTLATGDTTLATALAQAKSDIASITRAQQIIITDQQPINQKVVEGNGRLIVTLK
ncbi:MAG: valine--tRNA ligase [Candidatus Promineifilaceae bacterium]